MELGAIFVGLIMFAAGLFYVMKPLDTKRRRTSHEEIARVDPDGERVAALSALRDLDFDFRTGKVNEEDYPSLRARLVEEAAQYLEREKEQDDRVEALVRARKTAVDRRHACVKCGEMLEPSTRFCTHCGTEVGAACSSCGGTIRTGDIFCSSCGINLEVRAEAAG